MRIWYIQPKRNGICQPIRRSIKSDGQCETVLAIWLGAQTLVVVQVIANDGFVCSIPDLAPHSGSGLLTRIANTKLTDGR